MPNHIILPPVCMVELPFRNRINNLSKNVPDRDRNEHYHKLSQEYERALSAAWQALNTSDDSRNVRSKGVYVDVEVTKDFDPVVFEHSDSPKMMNIKSSSNNEYSTNEITLFIQEENQGWISNRLNRYKNEDTSQGIPRYKNEINQIESYKTTDLINFFTNKSEKERFSNFTDDKKSVYELWLSKDDNYIDLQNNTLAKLNALNIPVIGQPLVFDSEFVIVIYCSKVSLLRLNLIVDYLREIRISNDANDLVRGDACEQEEWSQIINDNIQVCENPERVAIIDSGIDCLHPNLQLHVQPERCHSVISNEPQDFTDHGTGLAGFVLFGDLSAAINDINGIVTYANITSVKIFDRNNTNEGYSYAQILRNAILKGLEDNANFQCSAVTANIGSTGGFPTLWSSTLDQMINENPNMLFCISAGNIRDEILLDYPEYNKQFEVLDPSQAWNAITVGAYTEKAVITTPGYEGRKPISSRYGLSPHSPTSFMWDKDTPIKPEILMEGGNAIKNNERSLNETISELTPITLSSGNVSPFNRLLFMPLGGTSAASALAMRLATKIKCSNPELSALSVRALMVHSAEWTDEMKRMCKSNGRTDYKMLLRMCGYGVPCEEKAIESSNSYVTLIHENILMPYVLNSGKLKVGNMHLYQLPMPTELLESLGNEIVKLKVTLSFYVEPNPGSVSIYKNKSYPMDILRFEIKQKDDTTEEFVKRISNIGEGIEAKVSNSKWKLGTNSRNKGSIISDYISCRASNLANMDYIAVYAKNARRTKKSHENPDIGIPYSIIISIETKGTELYNAIQTKIANLNLVQV